MFFKKNKHASIEERSSENETICFKVGFGSYLAEQRKKLGMNQTEFAECMGYKRLTQYLYEKDEYLDWPKEYVERLESIGIKVPDKYIKE